jgi:hypothetical protein
MLTTRQVLLGLAEQRPLPSGLDVGDLDRWELAGERSDRPRLILHVAGRLGQDIDRGPNSSSDASAAGTMMTVVPSGRFSMQDCHLAGRGR